MTTLVTNGTRIELGVEWDGLPALPCERANPELWFAEKPRDVEAAKLLCRPCPIRQRCLASALQRGEPWGVWGGEIVIRGEVVAAKRGRGRPRIRP